MELEKEVVQSYEQMGIVEKYETAIAYLYPIAQNLPRRHGAVREMFLVCLLGQVQLFVEAGKSGQISRLYVADAGLAQLRFWLRFLTSKAVRGMTPHQEQTAQVLLAEVGRLLGSWIAKQRRRGQHG